MDRGLRLDEGFRLLWARRIDFGFEQQQSRVRRAGLKRRIECLRGIFIGDLVRIERSRLGDN